MRDEIFKTLEARWHDLYDQYEAVKAALPPVIRWEYATRYRYDPTPHYFKCNPPRGRILKPPVDRSFYYEYGFDDRGRVIVERTYMGGEKSTETFFSYQPDKIEMTTYQGYKNHDLLMSICWYTMQAGRLQYRVRLTVSYYAMDQFLPADAEVIWEHLSERGHALRRDYETYDYQGTQLTRIRDECHWTSGLNGVYEEHLEYDTAGSLQKITQIEQDGTRKLLYRKREAGETRASLSERLKTKLVETIPQIVAKAQFTEPLYCLTLNYASDIIQPFPPTLVPGFESDRQEMIREYSPDHLRLGFVWINAWDSYSQPDLALPVTDPETLEACEIFNIEIRKSRDYAHILRTLRAVARELNQLHWSQYAPVTPDFIVYDCDQTQRIAPITSLRYSGATKAQIADWRKRGLL